MRKMWLVACSLLVLSTGCHAKFKKYAPTLGAVRPEVIDVGGATVQLGDSGNVIVDVVNGVRGVDVAKKLARQVDIEQVDAAFLDGLDETLRHGPPFTLTDKKNAPVLQVEVLNYGLFVPEIGAQGQLVYDLRVRIYAKDGERVYSTSLSCATPVTGASAISEVLGTCDNVGNVLDMKKREIQGAFDSAGEECGQALTTLMRKHAS